MEYVIGIDGGGTTSRLLAVDTDGNTIGTATGASTNLASNDAAFVRDAIGKLFASFFQSSGAVLEDCRAVCVGSAGVDFTSNRVMLETILRDLGISCKLLVVSDSLLALAASTKGDPGVVVIAGTGSVAYGMDARGNTYRSGGWGHLLDDGGSGYWIGKEAIRRVLCAQDGRGEATMLTSLLKVAFRGLDVSECLDRIYSNFNKAEIASFALYVKQGAENGDAVSLAILEEAAQELVSLAASIFARAQQPLGDVVVSGGAILNNERLYLLFCEKLKHAGVTAAVRRIDAEPVTGAIYLAQRQMAHV